jgi:hypothetical protein
VHCGCNNEQVVDWQAPNPAGRGLKCGKHLIIVRKIS